MRALIGLKPVARNEVLISSRIASNPEDLKISQPALESAGVAFAISASWRAVRGLARLRFLQVSPQCSTHCLRHRPLFFSCALFQLLVKFDRQAYDDRLKLVTRLVSHPGTPPLSSEPHRTESSIPDGGWSIPLSH